MTVDAQGRVGNKAVPPPVWLPAAGGFWAGQWQNGEHTRIVYNTENGMKLAAVVDATVREMGEAVAAVAAEVRDRPWPLWQRREALSRASSAVARRAELFIELISSEGCKTVREAQAEVLRCVDTLRLSAAAAGSLTGETIPFDDTPRGASRVGWMTRQPVGVVAAITPFNDPLNLVAHKLGPALIAGNGVVLKPASATPLTALALAEVLLDSGVPAGRLAVVPGGRETGSALASHPLVDLVSFTGGPRTGDVIARMAGAKKTMMELGGNNAVIVCSDAAWEAASVAVVDGAFGVAGQNCLSVQRVYVHRSLFDNFLRIVVERVESLVMGSKNDPATDVGPLISQDEAIRIESWVAEARSAGAIVCTGGKRRGVFFEPTVLTDVPSDAKVMRSEVFGPVVSIEPFDDLIEAVESVNDSDFGLQAGIFTRDVDTALSVAEQLRVGAVMINDSSDFRIDAMPFGGFKRSGVGREGVQYAVQAMTEPKIVAFRRTS